MKRRCSNYPRVIAVDFDGCLCASKWPGTGKPNLPAIKKLLRRKSAGDRIILWTCRTGEQLETAVQWCAKYGLFFDAINENISENVKYFGNDSRKIYAHEYWDDKAKRISARRRWSLVITKIRRVFSDRRSRRKRGSGS